MVFTEQRKEGEKEREKKEKGKLNIEYREREVQRKTNYRGRQEIGMLFPLMKKRYVGVMQSCHLPCILILCPAPHGLCGAQSPQVSDTQELTFHPWHASAALILQALAHMRNALKGWIFPSSI